MTELERLTLQVQLIHMLTDHDRRQAKKRGYNPHALAHYMCAVANAMHDIEEGGVHAATALANYFTGGLLRKCLKLVGEAK